jgi:heptosyltransferase-2/heptosyltransferase-3
MGKGLLGKLRTLLRVRRERHDWCLVPFPSNRWQYHLWASACGARRRAMHRFPTCHWRTLAFLPATHVAAQRGIHDVQQNLQLLGALGIDPGDACSPRIQISDADRRQAAAALRAAGVDPAQRSIVVHAGSARTRLAEAKRWPSESYAKLIVALEAKFGPRVVLLEGPDEEGVAQEICREAGATQARVVRLNGPLGVAAAVLEGSLLYVGSDSGLAHLAAAVGRPAVTIFAPADPDRVCPWGCRDLVVQPPRRRGPDCAPCLAYPWKSPYPKINCRRPFCVSEVTVEQVLAAVERAAQRGT